MAEPMENGPSNCNGEAEQVWERSWTLDEMRKSSANWSLAADSGLFHYMQDFSQWMLSKTHEIEKQLDGLIRDTKATDSCLHTVFNDFLMLSNIQFIENRVYDEEVEEPVPKTDAQERRPEQEKTREQKEAELIPKVQEAVNYGLKVLDSAFEQLDIKVGNSDSEDEEAADRVEPILEPKDLYVDRPLPYLIGSQAFMEQDDVGLGDLSSDEMSIDSDRESFVESEADKDQEKHSDEDFDQEEESQGSLKKKSVSSDEDEDNEDSDLFGDSDKDEDEARRDEVDPASFAHQLAARIKDTTKKPEADRTSLSSGTSVTKRKKQGKKLPEAHVEDDDDEMFKPPKMEDDEYSPFGGKGGLFSGGRGLFDDDDEAKGDLFSDAPKKQKEQTDVKKPESVNAKKIPIGGVSIFPENNLFGSPNASNSLESKENDHPVKSKMQAAREQTSLESSLFDEEEDDFFSGNTVKKSTSAAQEKPKPKVTADLFGGDDNDDDDDDEDGDLFSVGSRSAVSQQSKKFEDNEEVVQQPEKKLPAGAISMFGPGTNSLLAESLKKRHPSSGPPAEVKPSAAHKTTENVQSRSLFSDDEDSQVFPTVPKSQSKPEGKVKNKTSKAAGSLFDDDDEEDLFSSVPKSQSVPGKTAVSQPKKSLSSALFSDDEDQWLSSQPSQAKPGVKSGGMKTSTSAPSRLPSAKAPQNDSLFDGDDNEDLFAATKESRQKKSQRVSLLFEDENDENKGSLFGFKPPANNGTPEAKVPVAASQTPSLFGPEETQEVVNIAEEKKTVQPVFSPEETNKTKKPAGAVSMFGGISVLGDKAKTTTKQIKNTQEDLDDLDWHKEAPPPMESKEKKATKNTFSLFDDEEEEPEETPPCSIANKHTDKSAIKSQEPKAFVKSTGVFQDEELLFSQTQQKDNDPEVDLFAASAKPSKPVPSSVKPAVSTLFGEEEEDDDLFSSAKQKAPPKVPDKPSKVKHEETDKGSSTVQSTKSEKPLSPVKPKETSSRIGQLQASLVINPASLMPGAGPRVPSALSITSDLAPSSSHRPAGLLPASAATSGAHIAAEGGIGFDTPAQVTTLQNANKERIKGATQRRPQSRAARHLAAQRSEARLDSPDENSSLQAGSSARTTSASSAFNPVPVRPSALTLPISTNTTTMPSHTVSDGVVRPKILPAADEDLFSSKDIFASASVPKHTPSPQTKTKAPETVFHGASKKKETALPIFSDNSDDLFATVKPKTVKKTKAMPFLDDDDDDIFGTEKKKGSKTLASSTKPDIFQDDKETSKVLKKPKEQSLEASLFDDDIFADLTPTTKPKEKKQKKKVETKSIFVDDMDDIFSSGITKPVGASTAKKSKKPVQELNSAEESGHNIFDDPLNVFGGK